VRVGSGEPDELRNRGGVNEAVSHTSTVPTPGSGSSVVATRAAYLTDRGSRRDSGISLESSKSDSLPGT
jgi:hypothetical protein